MAPWAVVAPVPPWAMLSAVVRPVRLVMSLFAPDAAAPRLVRAPLAVVLPVPPLVRARVLLKKVLLFLSIAPVLNVPFASVWTIPAILRAENVTEPELVRPVKPVSVPVMVLLPVTDMPALPVISALNVLAPAMVCAPVFIRPG